MDETPENQDASTSTAETITEKKITNQNLKKFIVEQNGQLTALDLQLNSFNIFDVLNISHREIRHSNFIGWLLDPNENHGFGDYFLTSFINHLVKIDNDEKINLNIADLSKTKIFRETKNNIDIFILNEDLNFSITIENKIWHVESQDQLKKYYKYTTTKYNNIVNNYFVFLTPFGIDAKTKEMKEIYQPFSYLQLIEIIKQGIEEFKNINPQIKNTMEQYINNVESKILGQGNTVKNAQKIYQKYAEVIEFIYKNKPDLSLLEPKVRKFFENHPSYEIVSSSSDRYLRVMPKDEDFKKIFYYPQANSWKGDYIFGLEFFFNQHETDIKFCFGEIYNKDEVVKGEIQEIKSSMMASMKRFDSLNKAYVVNKSKPTTAYVGVANYWVLYLEEFWKMEQDDMFEAFKIKFKIVHEEFLTKFIDQTKAALGSVKIEG